MKTISIQLAWEIECEIYLNNMASCITATKELIKVKIMTHLETLPFSALSWPPMFGH